MVQRAIWARETIPSCIRAPPETQTPSRARRSATASSQARAKSSPATDPSEPPRKPNSMDMITAGTPATSPRAVTTASVAPVSARAARIRSG